MSINRFVHLHTHSHYSLLDGLQKVPELIIRVKSLGMDSVALTDHGTLSGAIEFYKSAKENGVKPIIGMEAYVAQRTYLDKTTKQDGNPHHLILLAMNDEGYKNLMMLASIASLEGFYYRPRIDKALLEKYNSGIIVLSACVSGEIGDALREDQYQKAVEVAKWYKNVFGDRYYLEVQDHAHKWDLQNKVNQQVIKIGDELSIPVVVTSDSHYSEKADSEAHEVLLCVQTGSKLEDKKRMSLSNLDLFLEDPKKIAERWAKYPDFMENTQKISERCNVEIKFGDNLIPRFETPKGVKEEEYLERLAYQGVANRYANISKIDAKTLNIKDVINLVEPTILERLDYELGVIKNMGFSGYFLIFCDFVTWGKERGIIFGPGRGSAAGSLVSYSLRITDLDPLKYDLLFERFLNPDRISMPDIDIDIQDDRRDEVIEYVINKYGEDRVAHIVTFGKMAARNAIRDTARVLGVSYSDADRLAKMIPPPVQGRHIPLSTSIIEDNALRNEYKQNEQSKKVIDLAIKLEGTIRSHGVHAAGVVVAPEDIRQYAPIEMAQKGVVATQYSMYPVEEIGLLKMDFLGLSNLTVIKNALRIIKKVYKTDIDLSMIKLDDKKTFSLLSKGDTTGVFQLESSGMKRYLKDLKPNIFEDIVAMNALYRPGPMAEIPRYIKGKKNQNEVKYPHPSLEPILRSTYGVMVYQEQIIAMLQLIAGYSRGQADLVRKAIGKKKRDIMKAEEPKFIAGCIKKGLTKKQAQDLWALIQPFADYSFPKAHAACYALIAYWTAYLKANYPAAFMAALLTSDFENADRIAIEIAECRRMGIEVLPPDVNESFEEFGVVTEKNAIRFGLAAIKNVGIGAVESILSAREKQHFQSVIDFSRRVPPSATNRKVWESLIKAGAFDSLEERGKLLHNLDKIIAYSSKTFKDTLAGQGNLFSNDTSHDENVVFNEPDEDINEKLRLQWEKELLGLYISANPLDNYTEYLEKNTRSLLSINDSNIDQIVLIGGILTSVKKITTKNGKQMVFAELEDSNSNIELVVFPKVYESTISIWETDHILTVRGKLTKREGDTEIKMLVDSAELIDESKASYVLDDLSRNNRNNDENKLYMKISDRADNDTLARIRILLERHSGNSIAYVILHGDTPTQVRLPFGIEISENLLSELANILGKNNFYTE